MDSIVGLKHYSRFLICKNINLTALIKSFYPLDNFFQIVIKAFIITLYMHITGRQISNTFQGWLGTFNQSHFIAKVDIKYLKIFKVQSICIETLKWTKKNVANILAEKKVGYTNIISPILELHQIEIEKQFVLNFSQKSHNVV